MSYGYMTKEVERLRSEIRELLPDELKRREDRLSVIEAAMKRLEAQAQE
jgi:hypothetical protein